MRIYNSLTRSKQEFSSLSPKTVSLYVCGITPYDTTHLGHAFTYISFDALIRVLKLKGYKVSYTQNVTDINDRDNDILKRAKEQGKTWQELTKYWTSLFLSDMEYLNWIKPDNYLYASKQIKQMTDLIEKLLKNEIAYEVNSSVYLDILKINDFGKLSKLNKDEMFKIATDFEEGVDDKQKRNPLDITLWKKREENQSNHIPFFESPFGLGRPGWHIECSAMAVDSLGEQIDIHGGGRDLIYPHHEAEIAQVEGATGKIPFAKYWLHTGQVAYRGEKMSKSLGNLVMVSDLRKKYSANAIRYMLLLNHYRSDWEYTEEMMERAALAMDLISKTIQKINSSGFDPSKDSMILLEDDLNVHKVLDLIMTNIRNINAVKTRTILENLGFIF